MIARLSEQKNGNLEQTLSLAYLAAFSLQPEEKNKNSLCWALPGGEITSKNCAESYWGFPAR